VSVRVIKVPDIGEGIAQVELVAWHVKPGDTVAEDQALADVMTDKATVEIPSPVAGQVVGLGGEVGQVLAVGAELIRIETNSAAASAVVDLGTAPEALAKEAAAKAATASARTHASAAKAPEASAGFAAAKPASRPIASPAVRARAWELGVDLNEVVPSGPAGRVLRSDLDAAAARGAPGAAAAARAPAAAEPAPSAAREALRSESTRQIKIVGLRRMIAQRMQESKRRIPHYTYVEEVDVTELEALRSELNSKWGAQRGHLTLLPFLIRAIVQAVREFPQVNARFDDEVGVVTEFDAVHVGIATQTDAGLMVPVVRDAQSRDLWACAAEVARLAAAARSGKAVRDELSGSTITITSLGRLGGLVSTPVINHPEVAIVGVNRIAARPVIVRGTLAERQVMNLSSSFDHRVIDGALAAAFVQSVRGMLERAATLFIA
jgi:2-oxoisovalerate dehydrogenase E2 component (dihydrolipoyl transacylase)